MLISFDKILKYLSEKPKKVIHIGGYIGENKQEYDKYNIPAFYIECHPDLFKQLSKNVGSDNCCECAVSDIDRQEVNFYKVESFDRSNRGCGSLRLPTGILNNPYLEQLETITVKTRTLDSLHNEYGPFDGLNCDSQGHELSILSGGHEFLSNPDLKFVFLEFNTVSYYEGDCQLNQLDDFLDKYGFERVITEFAGDGSLPWGDCCYIRKNNG